MLHYKVGKESLTHKYFTRLELPTTGKCSRLLRTFVNYGRKTFYKIGPGGCTIKLYGSVMYIKMTNFIVS